MRDTSTPRNNIHRSASLDQVRKVSVQTAHPLELRMVEVDMFMWVFLVGRLWPEAAPSYAVAVATRVIWQ